MLYIRVIRQHGQSLNCGMGVVIQVMVDASTAGVMFSRHPSTGNPECILITSNYGLGEVLFELL
jgi:phosphoenolpyruvate synthase/pyruvate phosphate dikinase